jgi:hypothetical protein
VLYPSLAFRARALLAASRQQKADTEANELLAMLAQQGVLPTAPDWSGDLAVVLQALGPDAELVELLADAKTPTGWFEAAAAVARRVQKPVHAACRWYSWSRPPSRSRRCTRWRSPLMTVGLADGSGGSRPNARWGGGRCRAQPRPPGAAPNDGDERSAASPGTRRAPSESSARRRRSRWVPAPASAAPRHPPNRTRRRSCGRTSRHDRR